MCNQRGSARYQHARIQLAREAGSAAGGRVLPGLAGIGGPWWRPNARAVISGIYGGTRRENVARAALEGVAWRGGGGGAGGPGTAPGGTPRGGGGGTPQTPPLPLPGPPLRAPRGAAGAPPTP